MEHKPWKVVESDVVYSYPPYVRVESQRIELPDGRLIAPYFRIDLRSFAVMMAVTSDDEVIVARQYRHGIGKVSLMLPGGLLEEGEDPLKAARRELIEETGFDSDHWESLGRYVPNSNYHCGETHLFLARDARKICEPNDGDLEETELLLLPLKQLLYELETGNIISLSSACAISLACARLAR